MNEAVTLLAAIIAGAIASVSGFGIGSVLTPLLALFLDTKLAVAAVSIPHFVATALRFWLIRRHLDLKVLKSFGITSALGGLIGALLHVWFKSALLGYVLAGLLVFAGIMGITRKMEKVRFRGMSAWIAGGLSGAFGGLVGNQGGIRSAALLGFNLPKEALVATATAIGLLVDIFRMPVYIATEYKDMLGAGSFIMIATVGVIIGTFIGKPLLMHIPQPVYRLMLSGIILLLGIWMFFHP